MEWFEGGGFGGENLSIGCASSFSIRAYSLYCANVRSGLSAPVCRWMPVGYLPCLHLRYIMGALNSNSLCLFVYVLFVVFLLRVGHV